MSEESDNVNKKTVDQDAPEFEEVSSVEDEESGDANFDELFLSPDEDSEGIIEMDHDVEPSDEEQVGGSAEVQALRERAELAEKEGEEFKQRWMRASADLENLRKRTRREKDEFRKYGHDKFALELLPVVDNLERALDHAEKSADSGGIVDGVQMVYRQIIGALEKHGIVGIDACGCKFDPEHHEAIQQVETTEHETGIVVEQYQKGYSLHDRLLRPAMVSVAKRTEGGNNEVNTKANSVQADDDDAGDSSTGE